MFRQYNNKKIYKNLKIAKILAIINLTLLAFLLVFDLLDLFLWNKTPSWGNLIVEEKFGNYNNKIWVVWLVLSVYIIAVSVVYKFPVAKASGRVQTKANNDIANIKFITWATFVPCLFSLFAWQYGLLMVVRWLGYCFGSNFFLYIADIFLGITCKLIRKEWAADPPRFILEEKAAKEERKREIELEKQELIEQKNNEIYENLIQRCGVRFFIKYYKQIESLPLRDVRIAEDYPYEEKEERLQAAREIIDKNLQVLAFENILQSYSAMLDSAEIEKAKAILQYLKNKN